MQPHCPSPDVARNRKGGPLSRHALINSALETHAHQNPPARLRRPRPGLRRHRPYAKIKPEADDDHHNPQEAAPASDLNRLVMAYKQNMDIHFIMPAHLPSPDTDPFAQALETIRSELTTGIADVAGFCGVHAYPAALFDVKHYKTAPRLCQIIADLLRKLRPEDRLPSATTVAIMWLHWSLWTWLLTPSSETYSRLPDIMRPTLTQVSSPHALAVDFIPSPALRDSFCQRQANSDWPLSKLFRAAFCYGPKNMLCSLTTHDETQALDITSECKAYARVSKNWSFDAAVEPGTADDSSAEKKRRVTSDSMIEG